MSELRALLELLSMLVTDPRTGVLLLLLAVAARQRLPQLQDSQPRHRRRHPVRAGLQHAGARRRCTPTGPGRRPACCSVSARMLPMYALRIMGAGDVKLMAMVGAFLGAAATAAALLFCLVTAGVAALLWAARHRLLAPMLANVDTIVRGMLWSGIASGRPRAQGGRALGRQAGLRRQHRHRHHALPGGAAGQPGLNASDKRHSIVVQSSQAGSP
jgi:prepilin peptidase CpaA